MSNSVLGDRAGEGQALKSLGNVYLKLQQYEKAIALFQQSLAIAREIRNQDLEARSLTNLGLVYKSLSQYEKGITPLPTSQRPEWRSQRTVSYNKSRHNRPA